MMRVALYEGDPEAPGAEPLPDTMAEIDVDVIGANRAERRSGLVARTIVREGWTWPAGPVTSRARWIGLFLYPDDEQPSMIYPLRQLIGPRDTVSVDVGTVLMEAKTR